MKNVVFALAMLCLCGVGGVKFYLPKFIDARINDKIDGVAEDIQKRHDLLAEIVKNLEIRLQKLEGKAPVQVGISDFRIDFDRWACWCDLKNKLLYGDECSEELAKFRRTFSDCPELLKMTDSLVSDKNKELKYGTLINNLLKFARIRRVDESELEKIAGYVLLSSIRKAGTNG